jgi:putative transposase
MPRQARRKSGSGVYHVIVRGVNKQTIFEEDQDKVKYLEIVKRYKEISKYQIYSYCLMDNHIHLLIKESPEETISTAIKRISSSYVYWYNMKYDRCGHLFQERFKSENVETRAYFLTVLRYIHQNPVKAGLATNTFECQWTSINEYVNGANMVDIDLGLKLFSSDRKAAIELFSTFMNEHNDDHCLDESDRVRMTDNEVIKYLGQIGVPNVTTLQQMEKERRDATLAEFKKIKGVTVRQLSRITGVSKSVIDRIR